MDLKVVDMNRTYAEAILNWSYEEPYDFYNSELSEDGIKEFLNSSYYAVVDYQEDLIGFFCTGESAQVPFGVHYGAYTPGFIDVGLGMRPDLTGKGLGYPFLSFVLEFLKNQAPFRLTVAAFNERAARLYFKLDFRKETEFTFGNIMFMTMIKKADPNH
ncbi:GNAT family N-acetyltransferase [Neobacillus sp. LXY-1]|uniref:GNAT family N-acetyltransferase n=1 Tax=Neobacillus sp. LXY-1 TaxID=3379133 RepID=UPI003EE01EAD